MVNSRSKADTKDSTISVEGIGDVEIRTSKRARHLRLAVSGRTGVYVVKPRGVSDKTAKRFIVDNRAWLEKHLSKMPEMLLFKPDEKFSRTMTLRVKKNSHRPNVLLSRAKNDLILEMPEDGDVYAEKIQRLLIQEAVKIWRHESKIYLPKRLKMLAAKHSLGYQDVRVKYMHTRWGSCSSNNNINLNIQLMRLEPQLIDHVILHELAHTVEHNHSKAFWNLFESIEPDARRTTKLLKKTQLF